MKLSSFLLYKDEIIGENILNTCYIMFFETEAVAEKQQPEPEPPTVTNAWQKRS